MVNVMRKNNCNCMEDKCCECIDESKCWGLGGYAVKSFSFWKRNFFKELMVNIKFFIETGRFR